MSMSDNYLHFMGQTIEIKIEGIDRIGKALDRIADELEKSNNTKGKHFNDNPELLEKGN